jgi:hypothetical protein
LSVVLALEIETERLDRVIADVLVTPFFACDRPLRGPAARADWRLCGMISDRLERAELTGELGEAAIFPTGGRMRAPLLLAIGLGPRPDFGEAALRELARGAARKLLGLRSGIAGIALPGETLSRIDAQRAASTFLEGVVEVLAAYPSALRLRLVVAPEESGRTRSGLLEAASSLSSSELAIRLERSSSAPPQRRSTLAAPTAAPAGRPASTVAPRR